jgi:cobalt/nickel transport system permease protein
VHIPDGYLGPPTYIAGYAACIPLWAIAARKMKAGMDARRAPLLAISAAFSFLVMMFNIPLPGGSTGHATGGVLTAIAVGPWGAMLSISIAVVIQALLFGDGGITAIGANCFDMAVLMPVTGYFTYRLLSRIFSSRTGRAVAAGIGGWLGLNVAALSTAVLFGIQPLLHRGADGRALYSPYPLLVSVPAMMAHHLTIFGLAEAMITGLVVYYLQRSPSAWILRASGGEAGR